jgi:hypothetical protein
MFIESNRSGRLATPGDATVESMTAFLNQMIDSGEPMSIIEKPHADAEASARRTMTLLSELQDRETARRSQSPEHARHIERIAVAIEALADLHDDWHTMLNPKHPSWHTFAVLIYERAQNAWASAGRMPRNRNVESPLAAFTTTALNAVRRARGENELSQDRVSAILRPPA